jgi:hypothetical protein
MSILDVLMSVRFSERVAEDEIDQLASYFVETDHWRRLFSDQVDVVYRAKGVGKSALYSLLVAKKNDLFDQRIFKS